MRHYVLAMPVPATPRYAEIVSALRAWSPGLRPEPADSWHIHLARLGEERPPEAVLRSLARSLAGLPAAACRVVGLGAGPAVRKAREVWASVEAPGLGELKAAALEAVPDVEEVPDGPGSHVPLAHLPTATDLRSFMMAHEETEFASGGIDRVRLLEARAANGAVTYRTLGDVTLAPIALRLGPAFPAPAAAPA